MLQSARSADPIASTGLKQEATFLIADVAALTGVPPPQLRSWEDAGILHPRRSPNATRLYSIEDVAQARLIKRSLLKPGRRGSLRRIAKDLEGGALVPEPSDYAGLPGADSPAMLSDAEYWQATVAAMDALVVVCNSDGRMTSVNPALRTLLSLNVEGDDAGQVVRSIDGEQLPVVLEALPLRWSAVTGTQHRDVVLMLPGTAGKAGRQTQTSWTVTPLRDPDQVVIGAVAVGRIVPPEAALLPEDWLAVAAHDLRNPVTAVLGRLQLARIRSMSLASSQGGVAEQLDQHLSAAERSMDDLIRVMDTVLDASAATNGTLMHHLEPEGLDLGILARQAVEHAQLQTSRHVITLSRTPAPLVVAGDRIRLRQVFDNILVNAIKYSPDGGAISVQIDTVAAPTSGPPAQDSAGEPNPGSTESWIAVRISDTGMGIPVSALPHVFERYWRVKDAVQGISGTGLGLYVCWAIVAAHGGQLWVERSVSIAESGANVDGWHGTVMAIVLPRAASSVLADQSDAIDSGDLIEDSMPSVAAG